MISVQVECYSGFKASQRPIRFTLGLHIYEIAEVEDQWYSPDAMYFRVRSSDGKVYILRHEEGQDNWTLEFYKS